MTQAAGPTRSDVLTEAREQVLERGEGLSRDQVLEVLRLSDDRLEELLALAHHFVPQPLFFTCFWATQDRAAP